MIVQHLAHLRVLAGRCVAGVDGQEDFLLFPEMGAGVLFPKPEEVSGNLVWRAGILFALRTLSEQMGVDQSVVVVA
ncbi:MAG: hypothetical protein D6791_11450 [Chloroflexi bacterium]|nr:MAG: hypothetical protein D6791_11450 [Chloroflexota bacterium]